MKKSNYILKSWIAKFIAYQSVYNDALNKPGKAIEECLFKNT
jgi:hypothetical protein